MPTGGGFAFGPFQLDTRARVLRRNGAPVRLAKGHFDILHKFVGHAGHDVTKDELIKAGWRRVNVDDNSLEKAISALRRVLGADELDRYIELVRQVGYRFIEPVKPFAIDPPGADLEAELEPFLAFREGRAFLQALTADEIARGRALFEKLVKSYPGDATFLVGLATACSLQYEMTRTDATPDTKALDDAERHAQEARRIASEYAEARATLGFILAQTGDLVNALAALDKATTLEGDNWLHWLRLASVCGGELRLRAARKVLYWMPGYPMGHVLAATVFIARGVLAEAEREIDLAIIQMRSAFSESERFSCAAVFWLKGLLLLARMDYAGALAAFEQELALESRGHLYARECCANVWYAIGVCRTLQGDLIGAHAAYEQALKRVANHPGALVGLLLLLPREARPPLPVMESTSMEVTLAKAAALAANDDVAGAATLLCATLKALPKDSAAGWQIPVEPLLGIQRAPEAWAEVLSRLRGRAM